MSNLQIQNVYRQDNFVFVMVNCTIPRIDQIKCHKTFEHHSSSNQLHSPDTRSGESIISANNNSTSSCPSTESSRGFLCSYVDTLKSIRSSPTDQIIRGKQPVMLFDVVSTQADTKKIPNKAWSKPLVGWVKLTIDGSLKENGSGARAWFLKMMPVQSYFLSVDRFCHVKKL
jgi:hypothetical protein